MLCFNSHFKITLVFLVELGLVQLRTKKVRLEGQSLKAVHKNVSCLLLQMHTPALNSLNVSESLRSNRSTSLTSQRKSFCPASELSSCTVSAESFCFSTLEGTSLSRDTHFPQTSSIAWQILQCHDPDYGILPCYSEPTEKMAAKKIMSVLPRQRH